MSKVTTSEEQQGFRSMRSTVGAIFIVHQLIEQNRWSSKHPRFEEFTKAFDSVRLGDVIKIVGQNDVDYKYQRVIK